MEEIERTVAHSRTEHVQLIFSEHLNGACRLFGGQLLQWIDMVGAVVARRHSGREVTTVAIDNLQFLAPVTLDSTVVLIGKITYVGNTSIEVCVESYVEKLDGERNLINKAYLLFVSLDENQKPIRAPRLKILTREEQEEFERGRRRQELRKQRRLEKY